MERDIDPYLQSILDDAKGLHRQEQARAFNLPPMDSQMSEWKFTPSSRRSLTEPDIFDRSSKTRFCCCAIGSNMNANKYHVAAVAAPRPMFGSSYQTQQSRASAPNRVSLPPRNLYDQQDADQGVSENADSHFTFQQVARPNTSIHQGYPRFQNSQPQPDQTDRLLNAMLTQTMMPLQPHGRFSEPQGFFHHPQQPVNPTLNPLRSLQSQLASPVHPSAFSRSPEGKLFSSNRSHADSSPAERVSRRKVAARTTPAFQPSAGRSALPYPSTPKQQQPYGSPVKRTPQTLALAHAPPLAHGIQLVSPHDLPDRFRSIFPYELFNAVQSKCFNPIYRTNDNVVVSAPTGSGKTALLELAICRAIDQNSSTQFKIVYQAPTKSLCSERMRDWSKKFSHLNLECAELTGDTTHAEMAKVRKASVIITTPEKWDSITRKWSDHHRLVQMVQLFLIDEVHIVKEVRGATLEAVVSRMKSMGANVRFVALSATIPNSEDIAVWFGKNHCNQQLPAHRETFGEDFRPVKLQKHVYGYDDKMNDFVFEKLLDGKLPAIIRKHTEKKPIMIFCFTRKSCENTAKLLADWWASQTAADRAWSPPVQQVSLQNSELQALARCGVAFHHAGLEYHDRQIVENSFLKGNISVICCTSTLAVGVNLPCHLVILKGTVTFQDGHVAEYSDLEVMQMLGRAGRPQFEDSAVAVIMTKMDKKQRYERMISGTDVLESSLHLNLIEHLNSEIGLGTVNSIGSAKSWLEGTFLAVRMRLNPNYYKIDGIYPGGDTDERLKQVCERDIKLLREHELVTGGHEIKCTVYGDAMSRYMIQFETMKLLLSISKEAKTEEILNILCMAKDFQDFRMKPNQRACLKELNQSPFMKFPIKGNISTTSQKISLLVQSQLGAMEHPTAKEFSTLRRQFMIEKSVILDRMKRLVRCVIDCKAYDCDAISTRHALELSRSFSAGFWEHSNLQLQQVSQIGPVAARKLVTHNINTIEKLSALDTASIERYVGKNPPFGRQIKDRVSGFPNLTLEELSVNKVTTKTEQKPKVKIRVRVGYSNTRMPVWNGLKPSLTFTAETTKSGRLVHFWRGSIFQLDHGFELAFMAELPSVIDEIYCVVACDEIVGTQRTHSIQHKIPASEFPPPTPRKTVVSNSSQFKGASDDEFGGDDLQDSDLLNVAAELELVGDSDGFVDVEDVIAQSSKKSTDTTMPKISGSVQMPNGKWTCNHLCRDGLKNGNPCKHKCCHEGLDKPPKSKVRTKASSSKQNVAPSKSYKTASVKHNTVSKLKLKSQKSQRQDEDEFEVIDLAEDYETPYSQLAPRDYQKLHKLHTSIQEDRPLRMMQQTPAFEYGSGKSPKLPFAPTDDNTFDSDELDELEFPSPSKLVKNVNRGLHGTSLTTQSRTSAKAVPDDNGLDEIEFPSSSEPLKKSVALSSQRDFDSNLELPSPATLREQYGNKHHFEEPYTPNRRSASDIHTNDDSLKSLEAGMLELSDPMISALESTSPKLTSSFANGVFDFDSFPEEDHGKKSTPCYSAHQIINAEPTVLLPDAKASLKRERSPAPETTEVKHRRIVKDQAPAMPSLPAWVSEFDAELINALKGYVEFVE
ncbi:hypothetical protein HYFRA_00011936 [Hymenoscyphus fraxineus]|uniref:DNA 3'-5' helicase n=1 Tax=Hymenoscyphus fraxineus TaxID=746836 RepID=A0A9N9L2P5_9HELO|nr:hypothetical protein HYFRA_00011936 [Hymenoscyphus fraxineus]